MPNIQELMGLASPPIAVAFLDKAPEGVAKFDAAPVPAGCSFWKRAMEGESFYTVPADHYNCAVGSYTHHIDLPAERAKELEETVGFMVANRYIEMKEVPGIPTLEQAPACIAYAPVDKASFAPSVVVVACRPATGMLLYEAAVRAGAASALTNILGRPGCAALPLTGKTGFAALSFGCIGNRTFTGLSDDQLYVFVPGEKWEAVAKAAEEIVAANRSMGEYYTAKQSQFSIL